MDVAGGVGSQAMILARAYPHLTYVVQDRAPLADQMKTVCHDYATMTQDINLSIGLDK